MDTTKHNNLLSRIAAAKILDDANKKLYTENSNNYDLYLNRIESRTALLDLLSDFVNSFMESEDFKVVNKSQEKLKEPTEDKVAHHGILLIVYYTFNQVLKSIKDKGFDVSSEQQTSIDKSIRAIFVNTIEINETGISGFLSNIDRLCQYFSPPAIVEMLSKEIIQNMNLGKKDD